MELTTQFTTPDEVFFFHHTKTQATGRTLIRPSEVHRRFEIFYLVQGEVEYIIEGETFTVRAGDMLLINIGEIHKMVINLRMNYERIVIQFDRNILPQYFSDDSLLFRPLTSEQNIPRLIRQDVLEQFAVKQILRDILQENSEKKYRHPLFVARSIQLLVELNRIADRYIREQTPEKGSPLVRKLIRYINENLSDTDLSLDKLSAHFFTSKYYLSHLFKEQMGLPINQYITTKRIHCAADLIKSGMSATDASAKMGYVYYSTFFYNYKK